MHTSFIIGFMAGLAATPHCLGMCGGFPLHLAKSSREGKAALRQLLFVVGKSFTYMFLGALAASVGVVLLKDTSLARSAPLLRLAAGFLTLLFGILMLGFRLPSFRPLKGIADTGFVRGIFGGILVNPHPAAALALGLAAGFLPCPLPLIMLGIAATYHDVLHGIMLMAGVGLGTAPGLLAVGLFGVGVDRKFARTGMRVVGVIVIAIGLLTIGRASGLMPKTHPVNHTIPSCCEGARH